MHCTRLGLVFITFWSRGENESKPRSVKRRHPKLHFQHRTWRWVRVYSWCQRRPLTDKYRMNWKLYDNTYMYECAAPHLLTNDHRWRVSKHCHFLILLNVIIIFFTKIVFIPLFFSCLITSFSVFYVLKLFLFTF